MRAKLLNIIIHPKLARNQQNYYQYNKKRPEHIL